MEDKKNYLDVIKTLREHEVIKSEPAVIGAMVMNWKITEDAGLKDFALAVYKDQYVMTKDALFLLDELEKFILENNLNE